jgi:membrane fusion protein, multidrug efflux system
MRHDVRMPLQAGLVKTGLLYTVGLALAVIAIAGAYRMWMGQQAAVASETKARLAELEAGPVVSVVAAGKSPMVRKLTLVGEALPAKSATVYAKTSGYLKKITVDTGDKVKAGQIIAEIESPEIDQQYARAAADLDNKRRIAGRTRELAQQKFFSKQAAESADTDMRVAQAALAEQNALKNYRVLHAPFDGVVSARHADPGALVTNAASNQTSAQPLVTISDTSKLKVNVYVDQAEAPYVKVGTVVKIADASNPERSINGAVNRMSGELDPRTRSLLAEVDVDNAQGTIIPGSYVNVTLDIPTASFVEVPANALIVREKKPHVALVTAQNKVRFVPVTVASTDGQVLRIAEGIKEGEKVALSLASGTPEGSRIRPAAPEKK